MRFSPWRIAAGAVLVTTLVAVGTEGVHGGAALPAWSIVTPADPGLSAGDYQDMYAVSCTAQTDCIAVGYRNSGAGQRGLAEHWDGANWVVQTTPTPPSTRSNYLNGISCTSRESCVAIGTSYLRGTSGGTALALAERWDGEKWSIDPMAAPAGTFSTNTIDVSCVGPRFCSAVGYWWVDTAGDYVTLAEAWDGHHWTIQPTPNPPGGGYLTAVACTSPRACTALGGYYNNQGIPVTLVERWDGSTWKIDPTPNPPGSSESDFNKVSCTSATACTAVGEWHNASGTWVPFAERWNGTDWTLQSTPYLPASTLAYMYGVSCPTATACVAVGFYRDHAGTDRPLVERWDGKTWTVQDAPSAPFSRVSSFFNTWCVSADRCMAVGTLHPTTGPFQAFAEVYA